MKSERGFLSRLKEKIFGDGGLLEIRYENLYGSSESRRHAEKARKSISRRYIIAAAVFGILAACSAVLSQGDDVPVLTDDGGKSFYVIRPDKNSGPVTLDVEMTVDTKDGQVVKEIQMVIDPEEEQEVRNEETIETAGRESYSDRLEREMRSAVRAVNEDVTMKKVTLPETLAGGEKVTWKKTESSDFPVLIMLFMVTVFIIFRTRYSSPEKEEQEAKESIIRELPEFINRIILLLNAGVVLSTAFITIMEGREKLGAEEKSYFYGQMRNIYTKLRRANGSLNTELRDFAKRSGVRELMRFSNIVSDNLSKGADLVGKLRRESEALWFARKKQSEEKGRTAETKLTFPLVLLLLVLVMVTIAPAMLEM
ncbi:MAG: type II secretion system F family protein [Bacillota bacterium]|nr:type II secretion system F family protein [Bacillota bacterium]